MAVAAHVAPFAVWLLLMAAPGEPAAWKYALRVVAGLALCLALRPWRWYEPPCLGHVAAALFGGGLVFLLWVAPESPWLRVPESWRVAYLTWAVFPLGDLPEGPDAGVYAPAVCGWPLTLVRLLGSVLVIAVIEEFFWRGFVYRWLLDRDFTSVDMGLFHAGFFLLTALVFGLEHHRWLAGTVAGLVYGGLVLWTRDIWAGVMAHVCTNLLLGIYVLWFGAYAFW